MSKIEQKQAVVGDSSIDPQVQKHIEKEASSVKDAIYRQLQADKESLITVFGLFASLLVFFSFEFQFMRTIHSFEKIVGFSLILCALLLCFNMALDFLIRVRAYKHVSDGHKNFYVIIVGLFLLGGVIASYGNEEISLKKQINQAELQEINSSKK